MLNKMFLTSAVVFLDPGTHKQHLVALAWIIGFSLLYTAISLYFRRSDQVCFLVIQFALVIVVLQALPSSIDTGTAHRQHSIEGILGFMDVFARVVMSAAIGYGVVSQIYPAVVYFRIKRQKKSIANRLRKASSMVLRAKEEGDGKAREEEIKAEPEPGCSHLHRERHCCWK